jgi:acetylornithine/LysW-gamma-L-lysine aminotransferase
MTTQLQSVTAIEDQHTSGGYSKRPLTIVRGEGSALYDDAGNSYLDFTSGMGVALLGHGHPGVATAIAAQAGTLITSPEIFYNDQRAAFYEALSSILPPEIGRYFLCNSGAEAIEGALKVARLLTGRTGIVAAKRAFHGRTMGALGLTWNQAYREPFVGWTPGNVTHITYNDLASADAAITDQTAAVVIEPVQGESGVYPAAPSSCKGCGVCAMSAARC